jgi:hypothetical protein
MYRDVMPVRDEVLTFVRFGTLPSEDDDTEGDEVFQAQIDALHAIEQPVADEEATLLATCFGDDNCFGLAWTLLHLIETAPTPLVMSEPPEGSNEWIILSWRRYQNYLANHPV